MAEFRNLEKIESPEASAVNQTPEPKDVSERDREKLEKPSSRSMEPERKNLDRDEKKKLDPEDRRKVSPDMAERGKEQEELEDPHKKLENAQNDVKRPEKDTSEKDREKLEKSNSQSAQLEQKDLDQDEKKKLDPEDRRKVSPDLAEWGKEQEKLEDPRNQLDSSNDRIATVFDKDILKKDGISEKENSNLPRNRISEDDSGNNVDERDNGDEKNAVFGEVPKHQEKAESDGVKMPERREPDNRESDEIDDPLYARKDDADDRTENPENEKKGGSYKDVFVPGEGERYEVHHMPADSISPLDRLEGPAIKMDKDDHRQTASCGKSRDAREYREQQRECIDQGNFREAIQMDIDDIHEKFGDKYDGAISEMLDYVKHLEQEGRV